MTKTESTIATPSAPHASVPEHTAEPRKTSTVTPGPSTPKEVPAPAVTKQVKSEG